MPFTWTSQPVTVIDVTATQTQRRASSLEDSAPGRSLRIIAEWLVAVQGTPIRGSLNTAWQELIALAELRQVLAKVHQQHSTLTALFLSLHTCISRGVIWVDDHPTSKRSTFEMQEGNITYVCTLLQRGQHLC